MNEKSNMNTRIQELLKMLDSVDDLNREIIEKGSVKVEKEREVKKEEKKVEVKRVMSPSSMVKELNKTIIGHPEAKKQLATIFFKYLMERDNESKLKEMGKELTKSSLIITGDSGVGKTFLIQELCRILGMDFLLVDCSNATAEGYKGDSITDKISKLYNICDGDMGRIKRSVILLDEFDKAVKSPESNGKDINGKSVQQELLKILEGTDIEVECQSGYFKTKTSFNTSSIMFICTGTFNNSDCNIEDIVRKRIDKKGRKTMGFLSEKTTEEAIKNDRREVRKNITLEDIATYGFSEEVLGRIGTVINLLPLTKEDYVAIAHLDKNSFGDYEATMNLLGKKLIVKEEVYELLGELMMTKKTNSRALKPLVDSIMIDILYDASENTKKKNYKIDRKYVEKAMEMNS